MAIITVCGLIALCVLIFIVFLEHDNAHPLAIWCITKSTIKNNKPCQEIYCFTSEKSARNEVKKLIDKEVAAIKDIATNESEIEPNLIGLHPGLIYRILDDYLYVYSNYLEEYNTCIQLQRVILSK